MASAQQRKFAIVAGRIFRHRLRLASEVAGQSYDLPIAANESGIELAGD